jgi:hypothetical protein
MAASWRARDCVGARRGLPKHGHDLVASTLGLGGIKGGIWLSLYWSKDRCSLGLDKESDELGRFRRAGVPGNDVNVIRIFIESFSGLQREFWSAFDLHDDGTLEHIDEDVRIVAVLRRRCTWRIFDEKHCTFLLAA